MATVMTKRGSIDNVVTFEHMCDTITDLDTIDPQYITLGSIAIVVSTMDVYIATSDKQWKQL